MIFSFIFTFECMFLGYSPPRQDLRCFCHHCPMVLAQGILHLLASLCKAPCPWVPIQWCLPYHASLWIISAHVPIQHLYSCLHSQHHAKLLLPSTHELSVISVALEVSCPALQFTQIIWYPSRVSDGDQRLDIYTFLCYQVQKINLHKRYRENFC